MGAIDWTETHLDELRRRGKLNVGDGEDLAQHWRTLALAERERADKAESEFWTMSEVAKVNAQHAHLADEALRKAEADKHLAEIHLREARGYGRGA